MRRIVSFVAALAVLVSAIVAATLYSTDSEQEPLAFAQVVCSTSLIRTNNSGGNALTINCITGTPCWRQGNQTYRPSNVPFSACTPPTTTTTAAPTTTTTTTTTTTVATTTAAPTTTTTSTSTTTSTTVPPTTTTTTPPSGVQFVEAFDGNSGLDRFNAGVWHRDPYLVETSQWPGDHDLNCGSPATSRTIRRGSPTNGTTYFPPGDYFYTCVDHLMTSVGDTSGYSIAWFSPKQTFNSVSEVTFDVNLTNLGDRKWWKVGVVSESQYNTTWNGACCGPAQGFLFADNGTAGLPGLVGPGRLIATWGENCSQECTVRHFGTGTQHLAGTTDTDPNDKMTRHPVSLRDNRNGTVTFSVAGESVTQAGAFPACPCRVVFYDHSYTPNKSFWPRVPNPYTWHWDSIVVR